LILTGLDRRAEVVIVCPEVRAVVIKRHGMRLSRVEPR
jgi:hypothetical protein